MASFLTDEEVEALKAKKKPVVAPPPQEDPFKNASLAIERLAMIVTHVAQLPPPQINIPPQAEPQPRPKRLEATITRDSTGKMERVVLVPIY